ncbi:UDP-N-acetylmuramoyl-L-alanyl-D-glutamate--2,6-diaminopimelate ligase [Homoserinibacter sp. GY 40078]|uniref:UDP-N-acetylmuramoyl-L-alanyl-D-glutamate--2, 6-diaminopimelate ligase n=1 Tax=Homoserinibacter sp. GY 40078 TaxID=2603275 RepID=UPI0011CBC66D|nr:UDP-N-acetylmuramoyl-L-alanyl-D-glutamate--2,6-diaminopimelate ligase [Homoserinibacter sp. GY 40078]TXK18464.1 UDP-N-acetylmuramoyl-L-alanyl-D-glutamate--2,6-diaminopimelate ligase [Homoserinibacter sp. GY 40078]
MPTRFSGLLDALPEGMLLSAGGDVEVTAPPVERADEVQPGGVFIARQGKVVDGRTLAVEAVARGAVAVVGDAEHIDVGVPYARVTDAQQAIGYLAASWWGLPTKKIEITGITGTNGKTTTTMLLRGVVDAATGGPVGLISTIGVEYGTGFIPVGVHITTPGAPQVQEMLGSMVDAGFPEALVEMSSQGLEQGRLNGIGIDAGVFTNLTHEHLDHHGTFEAYRAAKGILFERVGAMGGITVINADDPSGSWFRDASRGATVIEYGVNAGDVRPEQLEVTPGGIRMTVDGDEYRTALTGTFNVSNALAAIAYGRARGWSPEVVQRGLDATTAVDGRMQTIDEGQPFTALVDFAHTPDAYEQLFPSLRRMLAPGGRLIAVFGCAGLRDRDKRETMPAIAAKYTDLMVLTASDPRTEPVDEILDTMQAAAIRSGARLGENLLRIPDRGTAILTAVQAAQPGDVVVACGKGHKQSMSIGGTEYPWDDRIALRYALHGVAMGGLPTSPAGAPTVEDARRS